MSRGIAYKSYSAETSTYANQMIQQTEVRQLLALGTIILLVYVFAF